MNKHEVDKETWKSWSKQARRAFKLAWRSLKKQRDVVHPETHPLPKAEWRTIRFNAAFAAACACDGQKVIVCKG